MSLRELDFEIVNEPWNKYELRDGTILKLKLVLLKVLRKNRNNQTIYDTLDQLMQVAFVTPDRKGTPSNQTYTHEELQSSIEEAVEYTTTLEEWNEYRVDDGATIRLKLMLTKVERTNKFDRNGDPIYRAETGILPQTTRPKI